MDERKIAYQELKSMGKKTETLTGSFLAAQRRRAEQGRSPTELGGFHPSARAARGFLLDGVELVSVGHKEDRVSRAGELDKSYEANESGVGSRDTG